jgi:hypothetical protein
MVKPLKSSGPLTLPFVPLGYGNGLAVDIFDAGQLDPKGSEPSPRVMAMGMGASMW